MLPFDVRPREKEGVAAVLSFLLHAAAIGGPRRSRPWRIGGIRGHAMRARGVSYGWTAKRPRVPGTPIMFEDIDPTRRLPTNMEAQGLGVKWFFTPLAKKIRQWLGGSQTLVMKACRGLPLRLTTMPVMKSRLSAKPFEISRCQATTGFGELCLRPIYGGAGTA